MAAASASRMILFVDGSKILAVHVCVDLGRSDVSVAEHFLHGSEVGAAFEQVCCKRMAQRMRGDGLLYSCALDCPPKDRPCTHARKRLTAGVEEHRALSVSTLEFRTQLPEVDRNRGCRRATEWHKAFLASLSTYPDKPLIEVDV